MNRFRLKGIISLLLAAVLTVSAVFGYIGCGSADDNTLNAVLSSGTMKIGVSGDSKPMSFVTADGSLAGFSVDIGKEIAKRLGVKAQFVQVSREQCVSALNSGKIDIYIDLAAPDREISSQVLKIDSAIEYRQVVVVKNTSQIKRLFDLKGKRLGVVSESDAAEALLAASELRASASQIVSCSDITDLVTQKLRLDAVDAIIVDETEFKNCVLGVADGYTILSDPIASGSYVIAVRRTDSAFQKRISEIYDLMQNEGSITAYKTQWMG